jgi:septal ring factor EnvC (AmiA/AmiB activator)
MKLNITAVLLAGLLGATSCGNSEMKEKEAALAAQQRTLDSMNNQMARQRTIDSMNAVLAARDQARTDSIRMAEEEKAATAAAVRSSTPARRSSRSRSSSNSGYSQPVAQAPAPVSSELPAEQRRRGWSAKAKGAVIGAGTGAAAGAIINGRNRAAGAVIGGVLGAAAGTGTGAIIDKKNGRTNRNR